MTKPRVPPIRLKSPIACPANAVETIDGTPVLRMFELDAETGEWGDTTRYYPLASAELVSQRLQPSKIVCVGRNYSAHIAELNNEHPEQMVIFNKPNSAITDTLLTTHNGDALHYETELCFVIKNKQLAGVGIGLDLTKRALQSSLKEKGLPWERAKAFDGSALFSDFIELTPEMSSFIFELHIDGKAVQHGDTQLMLHQPAQILAEVSEFMGLEEAHNSDQASAQHPGICDGMCVI